MCSTLSFSIYKLLVTAKHIRQFYKINVNMHTIMLQQELKTQKTKELIILLLTYFKLFFESDLV